MTHTIATLEVSIATHGEIHGKLRAAGYDHAINLQGGLIDMTGIGLLPSAQLEAPGVMLVDAAMNQPDEIIPVLCMLFPDGRAFWTDRIGNRYVGPLIDAWRNSLPEARREKYKDTQVEGGFVQLRLLRSDYLAIPATSLSIALAAVVAEVERSGSQ